MRVLVDYRPALRERTGVGEYLHQLVRALARRAAASRQDGGRGLELVLFSSSWEDRFEPLIAALDDDSRAKVTFVDRKVPVRVLNYAWHRLEWPPVELMAGEVDVVHSPSPLLIPSKRAARVVTVNDLDFLTHPERATAEIRRDYPSLATSHVRRAHAIITISEYTARQAEALIGAPRARMTVCYPGAPPWARPRPEPCRRLGPIVFVGSIEPRKNLPTLLASYRLLLGRWPEVPRLILAGKIGEASAEVVAEARSPACMGRVSLPGYVPDDDLRELYEMASLLVLPSHDEGFGMTAVEAMAIGVPVVAAARGAMPEVVGEAGILVGSDDPGVWAEAIERVLKDRRLYSQLVSSGFDRAAEFSWDRTAEQVEGVYRSAMERRNESCEVRP
ncbi:MAG: glycosyltransferase family 4 protein [Vicinamibacterales bacterium]